jgi:hypothetical protein
MKKTWEEWRDGTVGIQTVNMPDLVLLDPRDPEDAIRAQAALMAWLLRYWQGHRGRALASYNWGIGRVQRLARLGSFENTYTRMPTETQEYIIRIERFYKEYAGET